MQNHKEKCIAIIPARGGSKRLPKKNILNFYNKPMIAWTIEAALEAQLFDRILVSTDSEEIAVIAESYGLDVPFLRSAFIDDHSPASMATLSALAQVKQTLAENYNHVFQLMANCPLRTSEDIKDAYRNFLATDAPSQISCYKYGWMNPWWAVQLDNNLKPRALFADKLKERSQDLPDLYCPTGAIWIGKASHICQANGFYCADHIFYPLDWKSAIDIDTQEDLELAKATFHVMKRTERFIGRE